MRDIRQRPREKGGVGRGGRAGRPWQREQRPREREHRDPGRENRETQAERAEKEQEDPSRANRETLAERTGRPRVEGRSRGKMRETQRGRTESQAREPGKRTETPAKGETREGRRETAGDPGTAGVRPRGSDSGN